jgi:hypothetical protein
MITSLFAKLESTNKELKESLENKIDTNSKESKRDFKALEGKVETSYRELKESNDKFHKEIETKFEKFQESMKADLRTETEKLIQRLDRETQKPIKQLTEKSDSEIRNVIPKVNKVQGEIEVELVAERESISAVQEEVDRKVVQQSPQFNNAVEELTTKLVDTRNKVDNDEKQLVNKVDSDTGRIDNLDKEVGIIKEAIKENTDVVLRRQREHVEQRLVGENKVDDCDSDDNEVGERIPEYNNENSVPRSPCKKKKIVPNLYMSRSTSVSKFIEVRASRDNISVESNRLNSLKRTPILLEDSFVDSHLVYPEHSHKFLRTHKPVKNGVNGLGSYNFKHHRYKFRGKCHYERRHDPIGKHLRQNFRDGH